MNESEPPSSGGASEHEPAFSRLRDLLRRIRHRRNGVSERQTIDQMIEGPVGDGAAPLAPHERVLIGNILKVRGRSLRYIQRKLAARYLPPEILSRSKQGFSSALPYILKDEYRELHVRYLQDSELVRAGILARAPIQTLLQEHASGRIDHGNRLWLLINSEIWYRMMILGQSREDFRQGSSDLETAVA